MAKDPDVSKKKDGKENAASASASEKPVSGKDPADTVEAEKSGEIKISRQEFDQLQARLKELEGLREKLLLTAADFENAKKRLAREKDEFLKFGQENLIRSLLPVLDNFERALAHAGQVSAACSSGPQALAGVIAGIQMVQKQLLDALKTQSLERVVTEGEIFDPHWHESVGFVQGEGREDEIVEEVEPGYKLHGRLLRAAKVRVRIGKSASGGSADEKSEEIT